jgi:uncharacterized protein
VEAGILLIQLNNFYLKKMNTELQQKIKELHQKHKQGDFPELYFELVWTHSDIVRQIAVRLADTLEETKSIKVNREILEAGALLHDIGMYPCYDDELNTSSKLIPLQHAFVGGSIVRSEGFGEEYARFCEVHTATGLTKEDIERENLEVEIKDYVPVTVEEELVTYADKFHTKYPAFDPYEMISERISKYDPNRKVRLDNLRMKYGIPNLEDLKEKYEDWSKDINIRINKALGK